MAETRAKQEKCTIIQQHLNTCLSWNWNGEKLPYGKFDSLRLRRPKGMTGRTAEVWCSTSVCRNPSHIYLKAVFWTPLMVLIYTNSGSQKTSR